MVYNINVGSVKFRRNGEKSQNTERIADFERNKIFECLEML